MLSSFVEATNRTTATRKGQAGWRKPALHKPHVLVADEITHVIE